MHKIVNIDRETYSIMQISHQIASVIKIRNLAKIQKWQTFQKSFLIERLLFEIRKMSVYLCLLKVKKLILDAKKMNEWKMEVSF